MEPFKR